MASFKLKFRPSIVDGREGGIYIQIIHNRVIRQLKTEYKLYPEEWDTKTGSIVANGHRANVLCTIKQGLEWDIARLDKIISMLEIERYKYTADDIIERHNYMQFTPKG